GGKRLYPAMPYTAFARISDDDMHALYAFFQKGVQPSAQANPPTALPWPFSMRWLMLGWNLLYYRSGPFQPDAAQAADWNRGAYLVTGLGHCAECHTARGILGGLKAATERDGGQFLAGAEVDGWYAQALRHDPARPTAAAWPVEDLARYLKTGRTAHTAAFGPMSQVVENSTQYLSDTDLRAVAVYLRSLGAPDGGAASAAVAVAVADTASAPATELLRSADAKGHPGAMVYLNNCNACHRSDGTGAAATFPAFARNSVVNAADPTSLIRMVLTGSAMPSTEQAPSALAMPGFGWRLGDDDVAQLLTFMRSSWGNQAGAVQAEQVAKVRAALPAGTPTAR
ncbi:MAG TPA: cytochrome c, partial [Burkholderiaceae bacterium]